MKMILAAFVALATAAAGADDLRALNTNRPSRTEVATTVDAGHLEIETDFANYARAQTPDVHGEALAFGGSNIRYGLSRSSEAEVTFFPYIHQHTWVPDRRTQNGMSDTTIAFKHNLHGNDGGAYVLALMAYAQLPTNQDELGSRRVEGGVLVPVAFELSPKDEWLFSAKVGSASPYSIYDSTAMYWRAFSPKWSAYLEFYNEASPVAPWLATADVGATYLVTPNFQLDCGAAFGLNRATDALNLLTGFSLRL